MIWLLTWHDDVTFCGIDDIILVLATCHMNRLVGYLDLNKSQKLDDALTVGSIGHHNNTLYRKAIWVKLELDQPKT